MEPKSKELFVFSVYQQEVSQDLELEGKTMIYSGGMCILRWVIRVSSDMEGLFPGNFPPSMEVLICL